MCVGFSFMHDRLDSWVMLVIRSIIKKESVCITERADRERERERLTDSVAESESERERDGQREKSKVYEV